MEVKTIIRVKKYEVLGDSFEDDVTKKDIDIAVEEHIDDYCKEHNLERDNIEVEEKIFVRG